MTSIPQEHSSRWNAEGGYRQILVIAFPLFIPIAGPAFRLIAREAHDRRFRIVRGWRLDPALFSRIIRFGLPNGIQFFLDMAGFTAFLLEIRRLAEVLLRFVALYSLFDALTIVFASAIKGAGDSRFVMYMVSGLSVGVLIVPSYVAIEIFGAGILAGWTIATAYVSALGVAFYLRFKGGKWQAMRVIEHPSRHPVPSTPERSSPEA